MEVVYCQAEQPCIISCPCCRGSLSIPGWLKHEQLVDFGVVKPSVAFCQDLLSRPHSASARGRPRPTAYAVAPKEMFDGTLQAGDGSYPATIEVGLSLSKDNGLPRLGSIA